MISVTSHRMVRRKNIVKRFFFLTTIVKILYECIWIIISFLLVQKNLPMTSFYRQDISTHRTVTYSVFFVFLRHLCCATLFCSVWKKIPGGQQFLKYSNQPVSCHGYNHKNHQSCYKIEVYNYINVQVYRCSY